MRNGNRAGAFFAEFPRLDCRRAPGPPRKGETAPLAIPARWPGGPGASIHAIQDLRETGSRRAGARRAADPGQRAMDAPDPAPTPRRPILPGGDMAEQVCSFCGHNSATGNGGGYCPQSPTRTHKLIDSSTRGYVCAFCGNKSPSATGGNCAHSPVKHHQYIAQHSGSYVCSHCGHNSPGAMGGVCLKSPTKNHAYV